MFKFKISKKMFLIISSIIIIVIVYLFPTKSNENYKVSEENKNNTVIYLLNNNSYVSRVLVNINDKTTEDKVKSIINYLTIESPNSNYLKTEFKPIIPKNTKLLSLSLDKDIITLNFSKKLLEVPIELEEKMISSIIYSLTSLEEINYVSIYVEGDILTKLPNSGKTINPILDRSFGINHVYDLTSINNTTKTTVYFLSKENDYYYYVPITMVNNNQKDKVNIIIEEMASKSVYQTGLISYLNSDIKTDYQINDNSIIINLYLDNDYNESLIETTIYSMNLSIKENYDVKTVVYYINNCLYKTHEL